VFTNFGLRLARSAPASEGTPPPSMTERRG
jgi:hypothetical protein